ncbi:MAG: SufS family cysteine desulfurase [Planctomycetales bacterium]|nr:SufS family cysteine desulfurase [Planctomycetales bacterium]
MPVPSFDELLEEFSFLGDWRDQCQYLIELGEELPDLTPAEKNELNLVRGCQSRVWFVPEVESSDAGQLIHIRAKSDAKIVDGLIVVLLSLADQRSAQEVLATDFQGAFTKLGLETQLVPQRRNGLHAMVRRLQAIAQTAAGVGSKSGSEGGSEGVNTTDVVARELHPRREPQPAEAVEPLDADVLRLQFPALQQRLSDDTPITFLDSAASAQKPQVVIDKEREVYEQYYANAYRGVYRFGERVSQEIDASRRKIQQFIGAEYEEEIAFTGGTTMSLNIIAQGWGGRHLRSGDEIVLSLLEHHANYVPWQAVAQRTGATIKLFPLTADGYWDLDQLEEAITSRTRVVSVAAMTNVFGAIAPLEAIVSRAKEVGAIVVVDAAQSAPHLPTDVVRDHVDFLAFSGHKLYGPSGVGVLYGRRERLEDMDPLLFGGHMIDQVTEHTFTTAPLPAKFEAGTLPIAQAIALGAAVDWIEEVGIARIHAHELRLRDYASRQLAEIPGIVLHGPSDHKGAIFSFTMEAASAQDIATMLDLRGVFVRHGHHCTMPLHHWLDVPATVRASFSPTNSLDDVDTLCEALLFARKTLKLDP